MADVLPFFRRRKSAIGDDLRPLARKLGREAFEEWAGRNFDDVDGDAEKGKHRDGSRE